MTDDNPNRPPPATPGDEERRRRARAIAEDVLRRRGRGEALTDIQVLTAHRDLLPELEDALRAVALVEVAQRYAQQKKSSASSGVTLHPDLAGHADAPGDPGVPEASGPAGNLADVKAGAVIPGYQIVRELGQGGQSIVFEAIQVSTGRKVAVKVLRHGALSSTRDTARFDREVQALAALQHPHIVGVLARGVASNGAPYLVTDYIAGQSLHDWIHDRRDQHREGAADEDPAAALRLFLKIADAINAAHLRGIVHRDIKPANIRLDPAGEPHIIDFGLAHLGTHDEADDGQRMTLTGQFLGSLPWASPEQAEGIPDKIDTRTDVYALGVVLYQMLTGQFPYQVAGTMRDMLDIIATAMPPPPSAVLAARQAKDARTAGRMRGRPRSAINAALDAIVLKALAKRREDRYQTAGEMARDVANYLSGKPTVAAVKPPRRRVGWGPGTLAALAIVAAILGVGYWANRGRVTAPTNSPIASPSPTMDASETTDPIAKLRAAGVVITVQNGQATHAHFPLQCDLETYLSALKQLPRLTWLSAESATDAAVVRLKELPGLRFVVVHGEAITDAAFADVSAWQSLENLQLGSTRVTKVGIKRILAAPRLRTLAISRQPVNDQDLTAIERSKLEELELIDVPVTDAGLGSIATLSHLKSLKLVRTQITGSGLAALLKLPRLTTLDLSANNLTDSSLALLASHPAIQIITLNSCKGLTEAALAPLGKLPALIKIELPIQFMDRPTAIRKLIVSHPSLAVVVGLTVPDGAGFSEWPLMDRLGHAGILAQVDRETAMVVSLSLMGELITDADMKVVAEFRKLQALTLESCTNLGDSGLESLAQAPDLKKIIINGPNRVSAAAITKLQAARPGLSVTVGADPPAEISLRTDQAPLSRSEVDAWAKRIRDAGGSVEVDAAGEIKVVSLPIECDLDSELPFLLRMRQIRKLGISSASDAAVTRLKGLPELEYLYFLSVPITDAAFADVESWPALKTIFLSETKVGDEGIRRIANAPRVYGFTLINQPITDQTFKPLERPGITILVLRGCTVPDGALASLARMPDLGTMELRDSKFTAAGLSHVAKAPNLINLNLARTAVADDALKVFAGHPKLKWLGLTECTALTDASIDTFAKMPALEHLRLPIQFQKNTAILHRVFGTRMEGRIDIRHDTTQHGKPVIPFSYRGFAMSVSDPSARVEAVYLSGKPVNDNLITYLTRFPELRTLSATDAEITDTSMTTLASWGQLREVTLDSCQKLTDAGLDALAKAPQLRSVTLVAQDRITPAAIGKLQTTRAAPGIKVVATTRREEAAVESTTRPADQAPLTPTEIERLVARYAKTNGGWCETDAGGQPRIIHLGPELDLESELPFLRRMPHLNSLSFVNASDEAVRQLADLPALLSLTVEGPFITDAAFDNVESWPTLMSVRLTYTKVTDAGIRRIANAPRFTGIGLIGQPITDQTLKPLERPGIPSIMLQYTTIPDGALASLSRMPDLVNVQLPDCKFTAAGLAHVAKAPNLDSIELRRTAVTDDQLKLFAGHPKLKGLGLGECTALTEASIDTFAAMPALERLTLHEHFQSSAAKLHRLLGTRRRGRIDIHGGSFQEGALLAAFNCQGFVMTVDGLSTRVETIFLNGKPVNDTSLAYLAKFEELRSLTVTGGSITDAGLATLANCGKLETLVLDDCAKISDAGIDSLVKVPRLKSLTLTGSPRVTAAALDRLRAQRPTISIRTATDK